ncbi:MAG: polyhydroxyalkanoate synthesis repressor PhaR [Betaproteobacteria bacterium TMED41]|nr:MAG: polyhydroxyalkanoate synthesis repressor PhaR [Betaproteobacteria bacterium TMED41]
MPAQNKIRLIKKYPNRRLYDTRTSSYVTLSDIKELVINHEEFVVTDTKTSKDLTRSILLQIILEEEAGKLPIFTETMLSQIIRIYGNSMQSMMGNYLEKNLQIFTETQNKFKEYSKKTTDTNPFVSPDAWSKVLSNQAPNMQKFMSNYLEQTKNAFTLFEKQMEKSVSGFKNQDSNDDSDSRNKK